MPPRGGATLPTFGYALGPKLEIQMSRLRFTHRLVAALAVLLFLIIGACQPSANPCPSGNCPPSGPTCSPGQTVCNGACVDLAADPANCGVCGTACTAAAPYCSASTCSATCGPNLTPCGQGCVDLTSSAANCGTCGNACAAGAACTASVCGQPPVGTGGASSGGAPNSSGGNGSGAATGNTGGSGASPATGGAGGGGNSLLGGYHVHGDWAGFAFTFTDEAKTATIMPGSFEDMIESDGPYCVSGSVVGTPPEEDANGDPIPGTGYTSIAALGFNTNQPKMENAETGKVATSGDGVMIHLTVNSGETELRVQLEDGTDPADPNAAQHRWCANLTVVDGEFNMTLPWEAFSTECWAPGGDTDVPFDPATQLAKVIIYVPDPGTAGTSLPFDYCVHDIGPSNVMSRGEGTILDTCGETVSWNMSTTNQQYGQLQTGDNKYQFQSNGWNWVNGSHSVTMLPANGFTMTSQTCNSSDSAPCSFPSIYIGTDADGTRTSGSGLPKAISGITTAPTCMGWSNGGTPASHEYNVSYDVWFNTDPNATYASKFLMVWLRDPPSFQPGGMTPIATAVIGSQTWQVWHGPNHANAPVTSYVAMGAGGLADGKAYSFDLKNFIDDAVDRGYLAGSDNLIAVMGGMEIWGGAQGASISSFKAAVQ